MTAPQELVEAALAASQADGCVVIAAEHTETNLRFAGNSLTTNGQMRSRSVTVISTFDTDAGTTAGVVTRAIASAEEIPDLVRAADAAGRAAKPADDPSPLVEPYSHGDDWAGEPSRTDVGVFAQFAPALGTAFRRWRESNRLLYGFAEHQMTSYFLGTSTGLRRRFDQPDGRLEVNGKSGDRSASAWLGQHTRDFTDVDIDALTADLERRLDWARTRIDLAPGHYETILPPTAVADLMVDVYWSAAARRADEGRSVYSAGEGGTRIGERLAGLPLTLRSDPNASGLQCPPFQIVTASWGGLQSVFDNGAPNPAVDWLRDGALTNLVRPRGYAARTNAEPALAVDNLLLEQPGATATLEDLVAGTERGLLLSSLWYIREVDPQTLLLTGLTRDGVYLIENGRVTGAVNNFRFNESPIDLLQRATEVGRSEPTLPREWSDYFRRTAMPSMRVPAFNMSTVSQAL